MKYSVKLTREDGKTVTLAANEYIDIDVNAGNRRIAALTLRDSEYGPAVFNENDRDIKIADCAYNQVHNDGSYCAPCTGHAGPPGTQKEEIEPRACENHAYYRASCAKCIESNN